MRAEMKAEQHARQLAADKAAAEGVEPPADAGDNFYQLLQDARDILPDNSWWK